MNNENRSSYPGIGAPTVRITRARAKAALGLLSQGLPPLYPLSTKQDDKNLPTNAKRAASGDNDMKKLVGGLDDCRPKKRAVLKDVTNINAGRDEDKEGSLQKKGNMPSACLAKMSRVPEDKSKNITHDVNKVNVDELPETGSEKSLSMKPTESVYRKMLGAARLIPTNTNSNDDAKLRKKEKHLDDRGVIDIDSKHEDPQMCSLYASDIYHNMYASQLARRPLVDYIEKVQRDINQDMRAILIDWLVEASSLNEYFRKITKTTPEVSDEYRMVHDTLYLTVNLIDRFLSENYIEKQKLQLLGVTCMLIASKYEEICAPRVEEFCFLTDHTYTKEEVVKMESRVLNFLGFQLCVPTTKKFLRRFIQAAQVSYEAPSVELEFLANYLAELTLIEYSFLKFLPSLIAASAVFLASWTIDQSQHPWNPTLEQYTRYKTSELKSIVIELQDLQINTRGCVHKAIREKYKQSKFKCVSTLRSSKPVQLLF